LLLDPQSVLAFLHPQLPSSKQECIDGQDDAERADDEVCKVPQLELAGDQVRPRCDE
jgi:hypothetical protein